MRCFCCYYYSVINKQGTLVSLQALPSLSKSTCFNIVYEDGRAWSKWWWIDLGALISATRIEQSIWQKNKQREELLLLLCVHYYYYSYYYYDPCWSSCWYWYCCYGQFVVTQISIWIKENRKPRTKKLLRKWALDGWLPGKEVRRSEKRSNKEESHTNRSTTQLLHFYVLLGVAFIKPSIAEVLEFNVRWWIA